MGPRGSDLDPESRNMNHAGGIPRQGERERQREMSKTGGGVCLFKA